MVAGVKWCSVVVFLILSEVSVAKDGGSHWYGSLYGGWAALDESRGDVDDGPLAGLGLGRFLSDDFSLTLEVERVFAEDQGNYIPEDADHDFELNTASLIARYYFELENNAVQPYVLAGFGVTDHSSFASKSSNLSLSAGLGMRYDWSTQWSTYLQAMYRRDTDRIVALNQDGLNDVVFTAGLNYAFGW